MSTHWFDCLFQSSDDEQLLATPHTTPPHIPQVSNGREGGDSQPATTAAVVEPPAPPPPESIQFVDFVMALRRARRQGGSLARSSSNVLSTAKDAWDSEWRGDDWDVDMMC
jgi:hypothetical protein